VPSENNIQSIYPRISPIQRNHNTNCKRLSYILTSHPIKLRSDIFFTEREYLKLSIQLHDKLQGKVNLMSSQTAIALAHPNIALAM